MGIYERGGGRPGPRRGIYGGERSRLRRADESHWHFLHSSGSEGPSWNRKIAGFRRAPPQRMALQDRTAGGRRPRCGPAHACGLASPRAAGRRAAGPPGVRSRARGETGVAPPLFTATRQTTPSWVAYGDGGLLFLTWTRSKTASPSWWVRAAPRADASGGALMSPPAGLAPIIRGAFPERGSVSVPRPGPPRVGLKARPPPTPRFWQFGAWDPIVSIQCGDEMLLE